ncbi:MAG TPA: fibronectin type III domain-containing protein [Terriglobia bacterium]
MATKSKILKLNIVHPSPRTKVADLLSRGHSVFTDMGVKVDVFGTPPLPLTTLKQDLDNLTTSSAAANDGGKKDIAQRDKDRQVVEQDLDLLSAWVLKIANGDPAIVTSSGFMLASPRAKSSPEPLPQPVVDSVTQGVSRQLLAEISPVPKAHGYVLRIAPLTNGVPDTWTEVTVTSTKGAVAFNDLTPGTIYAFQVKALGKAGFTNWSDSVTRMCI